MKDLDQLFDAVTAGLKSGNTMEEMKPLLEQYEGIDWKPYKYFTPSHYSRYTYRLNDVLEIVLICWEPGQGCPVHDHPKEGCLVKVLQGELHQGTFELREKPVLKDEQTLEINDVTYMEGNVTGHEMKNVSAKRAVSLHLYTPPNYHPNFY